MLPTAYYLNEWKQLYYRKLNWHRTEYNTFLGLKCLTDFEFQNDGNVIKELLSGKYCFQKKEYTMKRN